VNQLDIFFVLKVIIRFLVYSYQFKKRIIYSGEFYYSRAGDTAPE